MLRVITAGSNQTATSPLQVMEVDLSRPDVGTGKSADIRRSVSDSTSSKAATVVDDVMTQLPAFVTDSEGLGLLIGSSVMGEALGVPPPQMRAHLLTLAGLESRLKKNARNPKSSARGYLQFIDSTRQQFMQEGMRQSFLLNKFLPQPSTDTVKAAAMAIGMWTHYEGEIKKYWRFNSSTGWVVTSNQDGAMNSFLTSTYAIFLRDHKLGRQVLYTALHFYAYAFRMDKKQKLTPEGDGRFALDVAVFQLIVDHNKEVTSLYINAVSIRIPTTHNSKIVQLGDPSALPIIVSKFQKKRKASKETKARPHKGIDIRATEGTPLYAPIQAKVLSIKHQSGPFAYGNYLTIETPAGARYRFAHLSRISDSVKEGRPLPLDEPIAWTGKTGTLHPHLHFEYFPPNSDKQSDPEKDPLAVWKYVFSGVDDASYKLK